KSLALLRRDFLVHGSDGDIAAQHLATLALDRVNDVAGHGLYGCDRADAQRQAGDQDPKAAGAAAKLTTSQTEGEKPIHPETASVERFATVTRSSTRRPSPMRRMRSQLSASAGS